MFNNLFSFEGRIRRSEYGLSFLFYFIAAVIINVIMASSKEDSGLAIFGLAYIPMLWFLWSQGAKRCHDVGNSGWWQIIPFYVLWLIFEDGEPGANQYGDNPKGLGKPGNYSSTTILDDQGGYSGGYQGGHNNPNTNYGSPESSQNKDGYKEGDLYK